MSVIARSLATVVLLLAGCGAPHAAPQAAPPSTLAPGSARSSLTITATRTEHGVVVAVATAPPNWASADALSRGDDLTALMDDVRAKHPRAALRIEVTQDGGVVASADSPTRGRVSFSMKK